MVRPAGIELPALMMAFALLAEHTPPEVTLAILKSHPDAAREKVLGMFSMLFLALQVCDVSQQVTLAILKVHPEAARERITVPGTTTTAR